MASYNLVWKRSAVKELRELPREAIARIIAMAEALRDNPFPPETRKLAQAERTYRLRNGDYRLIYSVERERLIIEVIRIGHRKDVYR